jgi:hypothetical protein
MAGELNRGPGEVPSRPPDPPPPPSPKEPEISAQANQRSRPTEGKGLEPCGLDMTPEFSAALEQAKARIDERKATGDHLSPQRPEAAALPSHTRTPDARNDPDGGQGPLIKGSSRADASVQEAQLTARPRDAQPDLGQGPLVRDARGDPGAPHELNQGPLIDRKAGLPTPQKGDFVWRTHDDRNTGMDGTYWSPSDPSTHEDFRGEIGLPNSNRGTRATEGRLEDVDDIGVGRAAQMDGQPGGSAEYRIPDSARQIIDKKTTEQDPPY